MHTNWGVIGGPKSEEGAFFIAWGPGEMGAPAVMFERMSCTIEAKAMFLKKVVYAGLDRERETSSSTGRSVAVSMLMSIETEEVRVPQLYIR